MYRSQHPSFIAVFCTCVGGAQVDMHQYLRPWPVRASVPVSQFRLSLVGSLGNSSCELCTLRQEQVYLCSLEKKLILLPACKRFHDMRTSSFVSMPETLRGCRPGDTGGQFAPDSATGSGQC